MHPAKTPSYRREFGFASHRLPPCPGIPAVFEI